MLCNYYWIIYVCACLVNDGNGNDEQNEGKKINQIECGSAMKETREKSRKNHEHVYETKQVMPEMNTSIVI